MQTICQQFCHRLINPHRGCAEQLGQFLAQVGRVLGGLVRKIYPEFFAASGNVQAKAIITRLFAEEIINHFHQVLILGQIVGASQRNV